MIGFSSSLTRRAMLACAGAALAQGAGLARAQPVARAKALRFGLFTARDREKMLEDWKPFMTLLSRAAGREIEAVAGTEAEIVTAFKAGELDLAWLGNVPALELVESGVGAVFAQIVTKEGLSDYASVIAVPAASKFQTLDEVLAQAGRLRLAIGDKGSVSGYLVPLYYAFAKRRVNSPEKVFQKITTGSARQNLAALAGAEADVAVSNTVEIGFLKAANSELVKKFRVVWTSPPIPQSPLVWSNALPADLRRKVQDFCVSFGKKAPEELVALNKVHLGGFKASKNRQLIPIADIQMFLEWQKINNIPATSAEEKRQSVEAVARRGSRLEMLLKMDK
jgi:phosphonate transport system substrate-binding protein